jgi:hypothetical protein
MATANGKLKKKKKKKKTLRQKLKKECIEAVSFDISLS